MAVRFHFWALPSLLPRYRGSWVFTSWGCQSYARPPRGPRYFSLSGMGGRTSSHAAATLLPAWLWRSLVHEGPLTRLNKPATRWLERASHIQFHNRSTVWYTVLRIHEQKDFASQNKNVYFKLYLIFTTSCCCCSNNKNTTTTNNHYHYRSNMHYNKNPLRDTVLDSQEQSFTSVLPIVAEWIVVTVDMCGEAVRWCYLRKRPRIKLPGMIHARPDTLADSTRFTFKLTLCVCVCVGGGARVLSSAFTVAPPRHFLFACRD